ncbi:MAG: nitroreductase/quinone reductase family protein [Thermomicrobiales bacterium]
MSTETPTPEHIRQALATDRVIDITTIGRRSETPHRIETWFYRADGRLFLTGSPGKRDWYANLVKTPEFLFHLKTSVEADLPARATPITNPNARRAIFTEILADIGRPASDLDAWLAGSPLMAITIEECAASPS